MTKVTVMVFKDHFAARTFELPLKWIPRIGILLGILLSVGILTSISAIKNYRLAARAQPARVRALEQEISELQTLIANRPSELLAPAPVPASPAALPENSADFVSKPLILGDARRDSTQLPIKLNPVTTTWNGKILQIRASLQYVGDDGGKQNGRIVVIATGPKSFWAYPDGVISTRTANSVLDPEAAETFSVSRFREIAADFGPFESRSAIQEVQVLILNEDHKLMLFERGTVAKESSNGTAR